MRHFFNRVLTRAAFFLLTLIGCGGGNATLVDCAPTKVTACIPQHAGACDIATNPSDGAAIVSALCAGADARPNCFPTEHTVCVASCDPYNSGACK